MNEHGHGPSNTSTPVLPPAKRKRGRPRKDGNLPRNNIEGSSKRVGVNSAAIGGGGGARTAIQSIESKANEGNGVGNMVSGFIDGYLGDWFTISVRIGNNGPFRRGLVFEQGRPIPFTCSTDTPQFSVHQRREAPFPTPPIPGQQNQINNVGSQSVMKQPAQLGLQEQAAVHQLLSSVPQPGSSSGSGLCTSLQQLTNHSQPLSSMMPIGNMLNNNHITSPNLGEKIMIQQAPKSSFGNQFQSCPLVENLRMVEQDDAMQVYEVSVHSEGILADTNQPAKDVISESSPKTMGNNDLHHKEIRNQVAQNQDMGSGLEAPAGAHFCNNFNCFGTENHVALEPQNRQSGEKQNQDPYYELHQQVVVDEAKSLREKRTVVESGFQPKDQRTQNMLQGIDLELHETPVVTQNQYSLQENQCVNALNEIRRLEHAMNRTSANTLQSISMVPANMECQSDSGLFPKSAEFMTEWPCIQKREIEEDNRSSIYSEKTIHESSANGEVESVNAENGREAIPFDLEIAAAEETTWPRKKTNDTRVSSFDACTTELNLVSGSSASRKEAESNSVAIPESPQT